MHLQAVQTPSSAKLKEQGQRQLSSTTLCPFFITLQKINVVGAKYLSDSMLVNAQGSFFINTNTFDFAVSRLKKSCWAKSDGVDKHIRPGIRSKVF